ncbi:MAG: hypothetical protein ACRYHA_05900 [Janthinobacterium lividum]
MKPFTAAIFVALTAGSAGLSQAAAPAPASGTMAPPPTAKHAGHRTGHDMAEAQERTLRKHGTQSQKPGSD